MLEPAVIVLRLAQYAGGAILFGSSFFMLYALRGSVAFAGELRWPRRLLAAAALSLLAGSALGLAAQTAVMAGSITEGLKPSSLGYVMGGTGLGRAALVRTGAAALVLGVLAFGRPSPRLWMITAGLGAVACASFAWMGHAAATEGAIGPAHLASDMLHVLAASAWIGALAAFWLLLVTKSANPRADEIRYLALHRFSGIGSALVAILIATGLINSWILLGPAGLPRLWTSAYGVLLTAKLILFAGMIGLAASNRFRLTPNLGQALKGGSEAAVTVAALQRSIVWETALGLAVLALVAWLGTLPPPGSM